MNKKFKCIDCGSVKHTWNIDFYNKGEHNCLKYCSYDCYMDSYEMIEFNKKIKKELNQRRI